jgi:hypothetical protein
MNQKTLTAATGLGAFAILLFLNSCGDKRSSVISNAAKLLSSDYSTFTAQMVGACDANASTCTPSGLSGRVFAASTMLSAGGELGSGTGGYAMTFLAATDDVIERPDVGKTGSLTFDLTEPAIFSGKMSIPSEEEMPANPGMSRVEIAFDYIDTTFTIANAANAVANGAWTVRTVFVKDDTIDGKAVVGGDLLIKAASAEDTAFEWCNSNECSTTKPTSHFKTQSIIDALATAAEREGNPNYGYYSINFPSVVSTTFAEISDTTRLWSIDFDVTGAINWEDNPSTFQAKKDILDNFSIPYACNMAGCPDTEGISATLSIGAAGSATAAANL